MAETIEYNREGYVKSILDVVNGESEPDILKLQIAKIVEDIEKRVSLITFERNAFTKQLGDGYLKRI